MRLNLGLIRERDNSLLEGGGGAPTQRDKRLSRPRRPPSEGETLCSVGNAELEIVCMGFDQGSTRPLRKVSLVPGLLAATSLASAGLHIHSLGFDISPKQL